MEFQTLLETRRSVRSYLPGGKPDAETIKSSSQPRRKRRPGKIRRPAVITVSSPMR